MIQTDGIRTIANAEGPKRKLTYEQREAALTRGLGIAPGERLRIEVEIDPNRGPQDNGQQWNDDRCACGGEIADSPAGDKCWDCFNWDPGDGPEADDRYIY